MYFAADGLAVDDVIQASFNESGIYDISAYGGPVPVGGSGRWSTAIGLAAGPRTY